MPWLVHRCTINISQCKQFLGHPFERHNYVLFWGKVSFCNYGLKWLAGRDGNSQSTKYKVIQQLHSVIGYLKIGIIVWAKYLSNYHLTARLDILHFSYKDCDCLNVFCWQQSTHWINHRPWIISSTAFVKSSSALSCSLNNLLSTDSQKSSKIFHFSESETSFSRLMSVTVLHITIFCLFLSFKHFFIKK